MLMSRLLDVCVAPRRRKTNRIHDEPQKKLFCFVSLDGKNLEM